MCVSLRLSVCLFVCPTCHNGHAVVHQNDINLATPTLHALQHRHAVLSILRLRDLKVVCGQQSMHHASVEQHIVYYEEV